MRIRLRVPATTANLGPGFDVIGMALNLYNEVEMEEAGQGLQITVEGEGADCIACDESNLVYQAARHVFELCGYHPEGLQIHLKNGIPCTRGLGSSSAALVGGLVAANLLTGSTLSHVQLFEIATALEGHPDNVGPALFGGILVAGQVGGQLRTLRLQPPKQLQAIAAVPHFELATLRARQVVPLSFSREDTIFTSSHVGLMVAALLQEDLELFGDVLEDRLHQPYREQLIPGMGEVIERAKQVGALGVVLSGAGPTMIAFTKEEEEGDAGTVRTVMQKAFAEHGVLCSILNLQPDSEGVVRI